MKYLKQALIQTKAALVLVIQTILVAIWLLINAKVLMVISNVTSANNQEEAMIYINEIIILFIISIIIGIIIDKASLAKDYLYGYLSDKFADKVITSDVSLYDSMSPSLVANTANNIWNICNIPNTMLSIIKLITSLIITLVSIYTLVTIKIFSIIVGIFIMLAVVLVFINKLINKLNNKDYESKKERNKAIDEVSNGFIELRSFHGASKRHMNYIHNLRSSIYNNLKSINKVIISISAFTDFITYIGVVIALLYVTASENINAAKGVALVMYIFRLVDPLNQLIDTLNSFSSLTTCLKDFNTIMDYKNKVINGNIELSDFESNILFEDVSFSYSETSNVLDKITMEFPKGKSIGICGPSGGGKSTILKLLMRFYDPQSGVIKIDGYDIKNLDRESLLKYMGIVNQSPYMFDGTILDNVAYGKPNATLNEVEEACRKANIIDFIKGLDDGFKTNVGPRGLKLSGGQKQRIAIARVFLCNPEIILLDEATSALDNGSEAVVQDAIKAFKGKTVITVAHRLTTIQNCDIIYVIKDHNVKEEGCHEELMKKEGIYYHMYTKK